jgi:tRNA (mo5U34)-methyltransferase
MSLALPLDKTTALRKRFGWKASVVNGGSGDQRMNDQDGTPDIVRNRENYVLEDYVWWHSIRLNDGRVTPGSKTLDCMDKETAAAFDPLDVRGKSLLDVGAWNGGFSIEAKRRGAAHVVALDHNTWNNTMLRGRVTIEIATELCGMTLETVDQDLDAPGLSLGHLGHFDVVLFLGVFYHLVDPIAALREVASLAKEVLVLETHIEASAESRPMMVFYPGNELNGDSSNWWGPNRAAVEKLLNLFGFNIVLYSEGSDPTRGLFHAFRPKTPSY